MIYHTHSELEEIKVKKIYEKILTNLIEQFVINFDLIWNKTEKKEPRLLLWDLKKIKNHSTIQAFLKKFF